MASGPGSGPNQAQEGPRRARDEQGLGRTRPAKPKLGLAWPSTQHMETEVVWLPRLKRTPFFAAIGRDEHASGDQDLSKFALLRRQRRKSQRFSKAVEQDQLPVVGQLE